MTECNGLVLFVGLVVDFCAVRHPHGGVLAIKFDTFCIAAALAILVEGSLVVVIILVWPIKQAILLLVPMQTTMHALALTLHTITQL